MKHITKILPVCCVMFVALLFAGCSIKAPTVSVDGCLVSWDWVNNATSYEIDVNGTSYYTTENYYNIAPLIQENRTIKEIRVKALTTNKFLTNSGYSDVVSVAVGDQILAQPQAEGLLPSLAPLDVRLYACEERSTVFTQNLCAHG